MAVRPHRVVRRAAAGRVDGRRKPAHVSGDPLCSDVRDRRRGDSCWFRVAGSTAEALVSLIVQKFGGTSVSDASQIRGAARQCPRQEAR